MGSMTDERRKEMEEEMMRFEQEIAFPADESPPGETKIKPLPPPPCLPELTKKEVDADTEIDKIKEDKEENILKDVLPEVLVKPPPPPPPPPTTDDGPQRQRSSVPSQPLMAPGTQDLPPMRPMQGPPIPMPGHMQFIPHQIHRHPARPPGPPRPTMAQMRNFHPAFPSGPMHFPMPGQLLPPMPMHLPPMGMPMHMGPGFCPPPPPSMAMGHLQMGQMNVPSQSYAPPPPMMNYHQQNMAPKREDRTIPSKAKPEPELASAPAFYAAPPMKSLSDKLADFAASLNGQTTAATTTTNVVTNVVVPQQIEEPKSAKTAEESVTAATTPTPTNTDPVATKKEKKKKKTIRMAGGQAWEDNSLVDWDPDDFRIFCGDLGNDVTDEVLIRAFNKYPSFVRAKVIRDKRTNKTKGYGFVSFKDPQDFIKAMREMNGRYVGSRPIKLRKSTWRDRNLEIVRKKQKEKEKLGLL